MNDKYSVSPGNVFYLMYISLVGIGIMNFQQKMILPNGSENDGWISIIIAALLILLLTKMMYVVLARQDIKKASLVHINLRYFGRFFGLMINWIFILYFILGGFVWFQTYIQVIQLWLFPNVNVWPLSLLIISLIYYAVSGGFQSITAICFWGTLLLYTFILPQLYYITPYIRPSNLLPMFNHNLSQYFFTTREFSHEFISCIILLAVYPFVQNPKKSQKWAFIAIGASALIYLIYFFMSYMYFSLGELKITLWPTLSFIAMIELPVLQRMEYFIVAVFLLKILAAISIGIWASCHSAKLMHSIRPSRFLLVILLIFFVCFIFREPSSTAILQDFYSHTGEILVYLYVPLIFIISLIGKNSGKTEAKGNT